MEDQIPQSAPVKNNNVLIFTILEVFFVLFVLGCIFFLLNFMNIFRLDKAFPFLSFLPHLSSHESQKITRLRPKIPQTSWQLTPTPTPITVQNDEIKNSLIAYVKSVIKPDFFPSTISSTSLTYDVAHTLYLITWKYKTKQITGDAGIVFEKDSKITHYIYVSLYVHKDLGSQLAITKDNASTYARMYLQPQNNPSVWYCITTQRKCQNLVLGVDIKSGYLFLESPQTNGQPGFVPVVRAWSVPKNSSLFSTINTE